jgi:ADP-ribosylglycohydrolase
MLGAIAGDVIGSVHEFLGQKTKDFPLFVEESRFTDDSVLSIAVADCLLTGSPYVEKFRAYAKTYPDRCYGMGFWRWVESGSRQPYNSWGNGAAMRVSPIACAFETLEGVLKEAKVSAEVTHNHPEGVRGAQATATATFLARKGKSKNNIRQTIEEQFGYDLSRTTDLIRQSYSFNESCQQTVPRPLLLFSIQSTMRTLSDWPFRLVATPTLWRALQGGLRVHSTAFRTTSRQGPWHCWIRNCDTVLRSPRDSNALTHIVEKIFIVFHPTCT